jgi:hypothetical protein
MVYAVTETNLFPSPYTHSDHSARYLKGILLSTNKFTVDYMIKPFLMRQDVPAT